MNKFMHASAKRTAEQEIDRLTKELAAAKLEESRWKQRFLETAERLGRHQHSGTYMPEDKAIVEAANLYKKSPSR